MKKYFAPVIVALLFVVSGFALFNCGKVQSAPTRPAIYHVFGTILPGDVSHSANIMEMCLSGLPGPDIDPSRVKYAAVGSFTNGVCAVSFSLTGTSVPSTPEGYTFFAQSMETQSAPSRYLVKTVVFGTDSEIDLGVMTLEGL